MKRKIFNLNLLLIPLLILSQPGFAQDSTYSQDFDSKTFNKSMKSLNMNLNVSMKSLNVAMNNMNRVLNKSLKNLDKDLNIAIPEINVDLRDLNNDLHLNLSHLNDVNINISDDNRQVQEKVKNYSKSYPADGNDKLVISNKFGKVTVNTWNKNEFKVDVQIRGVADDDATAQKLIDNTSISDNKSGDVVTFNTNFNTGGGNSIWNLFNNRNDHHKVEVNYTIYMPAKNALDIDNKYGAIELPDIDGKVTINSAYGSFAAKTLSHADNSIKVRYGSANIDALNSCDLDVSYGSLDLDAVDKITGRFGYSSVKIGRIKTSGNIDAHYAGGVQIDNLDKNFTSFAVNASYSSVKVGVSNASNADFDITVHYGGFDYGDVPVSITEKSPSDDAKGFHPTHNYKGHVGKGSSDRVITIRSSYGGVKFE